MSSAVASAQSALQAFQTKLDVHAYNLANINTDKFKKSRVELQETSSGGVKATLSRQTEPRLPALSASGAPKERELSDVALEEELVGQMITQYAIEVNALTLKTAVENQKTLLDIIS